MTAIPRKPAVETWLERGLFASRWLMAPLYVGLVIGLAGLLAVFFRELAHDATRLFAGGGADDAILMALSLIDLTLAGNLMLVVIFSGYENFVSRIDLGEHPDAPRWLASVDFSGLKMKVIASVATISAVALLRAFMSLAEPGATPDAAKLGWMLGLHAAFLASGVMLAAMDWLARKSEH